MKNKGLGRCMRGCTSGVGDFIDWSCELHMRVVDDAADQANQRSASAGGGTSVTTIILLLLAGVAVGGGISIVAYKLRPYDSNPRTKLRDGPDTPGTEMATVRGEDQENDNDL